MTQGITVKRDRWEHLKARASVYGTLANIPARNVGPDPVVREV